MKLAIVILTALLSSTAWSQAADRPGNQTGAKTTEPSSDTAIVQQLAAGGTAEVAAGKVASSKAQNQKVKEFGQQMVTDHTKANDKLMALAKTKNINVQAKPDSEHTAKLAELEKLSGSAFDKKYMEGQVEDHQKTVQLLQRAISSGKDSDIRQFATDTLPVVTHHLDMAKQLQVSVSGSDARTPADKPSKLPADRAPGKSGTY